MPDQKRRQLVYRRAAWFRGDEVNASFQQLLTSAHQNLPDIADNRIELSDGMVAEIRHAKTTGGGCYLHVAAYTPGEATNVVPHVDDSPQGDIGVATAPPDTEFMDGDFMLRATEDNVILVTSGVREGRVGRYLSRLFEKAGLAPWSFEFELLTIADRNKTRMIEEEGVRKIALNVALYGESVREDAEQHDRQTIVRRVGTSILDALIQRDGGPDEWREAENVQAKLVITYDGRRAGGLSGQEIMQEVAEEMLETEDDSFRIETMNGNRFSQAEIALRKPVDLPAFAKTVDYVAAWDALDTFYSELEQSGALEH